MSECLTRRAAQLATLAAVYASSGCRTPPQLRAPIALDASFTKVVDACNAVLYETKHDGDDTGHPDVCCRLQASGAGYRGHGTGGMVQGGGAGCRRVAQGTGGMVQGAWYRVEAPAAGECWSSASWVFGS